MTNLYGSTTGSAASGELLGVAGVRTEQTSGLLLAGFHAQATTDAANAAALSGLSAVRFALAQSALVPAAAMLARRELVPAFRPKPYVTVEEDGTAFVLTVSTAPDRPHRLRQRWFAFRTIARRNAALDSALAEMGYERESSWQSAGGDALVCQALIRGVRRLTDA